MKIVILGAGQVGGSVAESLVSEANDITVVDIEPQRLRDAAGAARPAHGGRQRRASLGARAGRRRATPTCWSRSRSRDETNLVACQHRRAHVQRADDASRACAPPTTSRTSSVLGEDGFDVDLVDLPGADPDRLHRQAGRVPGGAAGAGVRRRQGQPGRGAGVRRRAAGRPSAQGSAPPHPERRRAHRRHLSRRRLDRAATATRSSRRATRCSAWPPPQHIREVMRELRRMDRPVRRVMIAGGGNIGLRLAHRARGRAIQCQGHRANKRRRELLAQQLRRSAGAERRRDRRGAARGREHRRDGSVRRADQRRREQHHELAAREAHGCAAGDVADQPQVLRRPDAERPDRHRDLAGAGDDRHAARARAPRRRGRACTSLRRGAAEALEAVVHGDRESCKVADRRVETRSTLPHGHDDRRGRARRPGASWRTTTRSFGPRTTSSCS